LSAAPRFGLLSNAEMADYVRLCEQGERLETELQRWFREQAAAVARQDARRQGKG
jgi:hypothetical protein